MVQRVADRTQWRIGRHFKEPDHPPAEQFLFDLSEVVGDDIGRYGVFMRYEGIKRVEHSNNVPGSLVVFTDQALRAIEADFGPYQFTGTAESMLDDVDADEPIGVTLFSWGHPRWGQPMSTLIVYVAIVLQRPADLAVSHLLPTVMPQSGGLGMMPVMQESPPWRPMVGTVLTEAELLYEMPARIVNAMRVLDVVYPVKPDLVDDLGRWIAGAGV